MIHPERQIIATGGETTVMLPLYHSLSTHRRAPKKAVFGACIEQSLEAEIGSIPQMCHG